MVLFNYGPNCLTMDLRSGVGQGDRRKLPNSEEAHWSTLYPIPRNLKPEPQTLNPKPQTPNVNETAIFSTPSRVRESYQI